MKVRILIPLVKLTAGIVLATVCHAIAAVPVGPALPSEKPKQTSTAKTSIGPSYPPLNIPDLHLAVVVLDPQLDENDDRMRERGVWPEVRKTESIRTAYRIKQAVERLNQFDKVSVAPSATVSADLYFRGKIESSTAEIMKIRWNLIDARGVEWIDWKSSDHRVALGWHKRFYEPGKDAFQPLWNEIANDIYAVLKRTAEQHAKVMRENETRLKRGRSPRLSDLEKIALTKELVLARFFAPNLFADTLTVNKRDQWEINYVPDRTSKDWHRISEFASKDQDVASLYDKQYDAFFEKVNPDYEKWMNEVYPYAREMRREQRRYKIERAVGGVVLAASVIAAADAGSAAGAKDALTAGALVGGGLIAKSLIDRADFKATLELFDELSASYHDSFQATNLVIQGETVTLQGKAGAQFAQWRGLIHELYNQDQADTFAVRVLDD